MTHEFHIISDILTVIFMAGGLFFMALAALGLVRMPDVYHRMHATTKGVTLGITGLLIAAAITLSNHPDASPIRIITLVSLVIIFSFIANPVGAHLLAKAAHLDGAPVWEGTLRDELDEDQNHH